MGNFARDPNDEYASVKHKIDGIRSEIASTIYCAAMIYEMSDKDDEEAIDFYRDCNSLSTALAKIYAIRFRETVDIPFERVSLESKPICSYRDIVKVSDTMLNVSSKNVSHMTTALIVMRCCAHLSFAIASRLKMIGLTND